MFPDGAFSEDNLERKLRRAFPGPAEAEAREILSELDRMPIGDANEEWAGSLRRRAKFDAIRLGNGDLDRLRSVVREGMHDYGDLQMHAEAPHFRGFSSENPAFAEFNRRDLEEFIAWLQE